MPQRAAVLHLCGSKTVQPGQQPAIQLSTVKIDCSQCGEVEGILYFQAAADKAATAHQRVNVHAAIFVKLV